MEDIVNLRNDRVANVASIPIVHNSLAHTAMVRSANPNVLLSFGRLLASALPLNIPDGRLCEWRAMFVRTQQPEIRMCVSGWFLPKYGLLPANTSFLNDNSNFEVEHALLIAFCLRVHTFSVRLPQVARKFPHRIRGQLFRQTC